MRPARLCRASAAPTWLGRAPLHAAAISCCVLPVASARIWSPRFDELRLRPGAFAVVVGSCRLAVARKHTLGRLQFAELTGELVALHVDARKRFADPHQCGNGSPLVRQRST